MVFHLVEDVGETANGGGHVGVVDDAEAGVFECRTDGVQRRVVACLGAEHRFAAALHEEVAEILVVL